MAQKFIVAFFLMLIMIAGVQAQNQKGNWAVGPHLLVSFPQSDFANLSRTGEGIGGKALYHLFHNPNLYLRADLAYLSYGEKRKTETYSAGGYFLVTVRNESFQFTVGPQLVFERGPFTPYCAVMGGIYNYSTIVSIPDAYYYYGYAPAETTSSLTRAGFNVNGGIMIDIGLGPFLDFNVKYQKIANAVKTTQDNNTVKSDAEDINISLGVVFFLNQ